MERYLSGDLPCNAECANRHCRYNQSGLCADNATCEDRRDAE